MLSASHILLSSSWKKNLFPCHSEALLFLLCLLKILTAEGRFRSCPGAPPPTCCIFLNSCHTAPQSLPMFLCPSEQIVYQRTERIAISTANSLLLNNWSAAGALIEDKDTGEFLIKAAYDPRGDKKAPVRQWEQPSPGYMETCWKCLFWQGKITTRSVA